MPKGTKWLSEWVRHGIETANASKQLQFNFLSAMNLAKWKVVQLQGNLPTHLLLITTFSLFWSFGHTPSSIEFIGDVICTQDFLLAPRVKKPIDRATKYWGLGTSPLIVFKLSGTRMQFGHGKRAKFFHEQLKAMLFIYVWIYENGAKHCIPHTLISHWFH